MRRHSSCKPRKVRVVTREDLGVAQVIKDQPVKAISTSFPAASPIWTVAILAIQTFQTISANSDKFETPFVESEGALKMLMTTADHVPENEDYPELVADIIESIIAVLLGGF